MTWGFTKQGLDVQTLLESLEPGNVWGTNLTIRNAAPSLTLTDTDDGFAGILARAALTVGAKTWTFPNITGTVGIFSAVTKGHVLSSNGTVPTILAVGSNRFGLVADSAQTVGLKYADVGQVLGTTGNPSVPASTTHFIAPGATTTDADEGNRFFQVQRAGVLRRLNVRLITAQPASGTLVLTVRNNGVNTALTVTVAAALGGGNNVLDSTNTVSFAVGDLLSIGLVNNATGTSCQFHLSMVDDPA